MAACASPELNRSATQKHESHMRELGGVHERLARQRWTAQEDVRRLRVELDRDALAADVARAAAEAKAAELTEALRVLRTMEEDLIAARKRHDAIAAQIATLKAAEETVATLAASLAKLGADATALAAEVEAREGELTAQRATATARRAAVAPALEALAAATVALDAALAGCAALLPASAASPETKKE